MGNRLSGVVVLAQLDAHLTTFFPAISVLAVVILDFLSFRAVIVIVIYTPVLWRLFEGVCIVRRVFCHWNYPFRLELVGSFWFDSFSGEDYTATSVIQKPSTHDQ
jgi:hypothetical protein